MCRCVIVSCEGYGLRFLILVTVFTCGGVLRRDSHSASTTAGCHPGCALPHTHTPLRSMDNPPASPTQARLGGHSQRPGCTRPSSRRTPALEPTAIPPSDPASRRYCTYCCATRTPHPSPTATPPSGPPPPQPGTLPRPKGTHSALPTEARQGGRAWPRRCTRWCPRGTPPPSPTSTPPSVRSSLQRCTSMRPSGSPTASASGEAPCCRSWRREQRSTRCGSILLGSPTSPHPDDLPQRRTRKLRDEVAGWRETETEIARKASGLRARRPSWLWSRRGSHAPSPTEAA
mmetsp:Transcript_20504/g.36563  ORF Transcript_20504/g.36563 Transcript_20504/m.36563 type:complete len:288 (-) Transcript_20504:71-934(-)